MPKDKSSRSYTNRTDDFFYKPYSRGGSASKEEVVPAEWEDATCPICMESPHNAVILLCTSHDKGCHPYMCDTSYRHSNCLDQYLKSHAKAQEAVTDQTLCVSSNLSEDSTGLRTCKGLELVCPLCRGNVVGWRVPQRARKHLNFKHRGCANEKCTYVGAYEELRKHARYVHPSVRPSDIDPERQREWWRLERQRDIGDVFSTIRSAMPGATIVGDYVIEEGDEEHNEDEDEEDDEEEGNVSTVNDSWWTMFLLFRLFGSRDEQHRVHRHESTHTHHSTHHHHGSSSSRRELHTNRDSYSSRDSGRGYSRRTLWGESYEGGSSSSRGSLERHRSTGSSSSRRRRSHH